MMVNLRTDILILGGGIAGLSLAINIAKKNNSKNIVVLARESIDISSTSMAQGGMASSENKYKNIKKHIEDTLIVGNFKNDKNIVKYVIKNSHRAVSFLEEIGVKFDSDLLLEGGHSENRVHHFKDITGKEIQKKLIKAASKYNNIKILEKFYAFNLITEGKNICYGAEVFSINDKRVFGIIADKTVIATGGLGQIYLDTTNPTISCGNGISLAIKNNVKTLDLDFVQFHPTVLYSENSSENSFLISESVRGAGAFLENINGERFMKNYDKREDLAPRDIISRSILKEIDKTKSKYVFLNISKIKDFENKFPNINQHLVSLNISEKIPVSPMAHYLCGGIKVNKSSKTSMKNLYAMGECANTGLHGSNRLASNSLLEAVVFALGFVDRTIFKISGVKKNKDTFINIVEFRDDILFDLKYKLKTIMQEYMGIEKSNFSIGRAEEEINKIKEEIKNYSKKFYLDYLELENILILSEKMVIDSKNRTENTGVFYNKDLK